MIKSYKIQYIKSKKTDPITRWGGLPNHWKGFEEWPVCGCCHHPMSFIMQITSGEIDLKGNKALQLFGCVINNCELYHPSSSVKPSSVSKLFLIQTSLLNEVNEHPENTHILKNTRIKLKQVKEPSLQERESEDDEIYMKSFSKAHFDKFYGLSATGNDIHEVKCTTCSKPMVFLGQFTQGDLGGFQDWFISILLICEKGHEASYQAIRG